ncbi:PucR family transcriptional regulator ligand-binding domain-containing protein [Streptomyces alboflavus]|uniref:PucR family transcriptional regulator ligand-binding domain-containing protein n=1 Tax=Streptomyces alboflavus TaxID=67267 RepID=UPI000B20594C|nr:PucR family transcriptional regulator ligand-binding domain-containing protein [Streptomyces alboflavus]
MADAPDTLAAAPPTPPVPLTALLAHEELGLRQIAGPDAARTGAVVHWVHTSEMADPYPYLLGGELLLTAGVHVPAADADRVADRLDAYAARIVAAGGAALGFGVAPVHDTVPEALVDACERHGLPLLEVPPRTTFSGVARAVWQLMAEARHAELRRVTQAQQGLAAAASRPDPVPALLRQLAARLSGYAALYGADGTPAQSAGTPPEPGAGAALGRLVGVVNPGGGTPSDEGRGTGAGGSAARGQAERAPRPAPASATDTVAGTHLAAYALAGAHGLALGVATRQREPGDHTLAGVAAVLLSLLTAPHQGAAESARSAALVRLLLGAAPEDVAPLLGPGRWTVVHARVRGGDHERTPATPASLAAALGSVLADDGRGVDGGGAADPRGVARDESTDGGGREAGSSKETGSGREAGSSKEAGSSREAGSGKEAESRTPGAGTPRPVRLLLPADREPAPQAGWTLGVSAPAGAEALPAADAQAARALRRAEATRVPFVRHRETGLAGLVAPAEADAHARTLLAPLGDGGPLPETLRTWLSLHGSWDRTAAALSVHRNTVRQRVTRCATLLDVDLDDPDVRMELWFALGRTGGAG